MSVAQKGYVHAGGPTEDALFDYVAGRLHPQAGQWIAEHVESCQRCTSAVEQVSSVRAALEPPAESPFQRQSDITAVRRRLATPRGFTRRPKLFWSVGVSFAAMALATWFGIHRLHPVTAVPQVAVAPLGAPAPWSVIAREGGADVQVGDDHAVLQANQALPTGGVLVVQPGSRVVARWGAARLVVDGAQGGARLRLEASRTDERTLKLDKGRVVLDVDPLAEGNTLAVVTDDVRVTVHGTIFLVDRSAEGTTVAVERGRVKVASRNRTVDVDAGLRLAPGAAATSALEKDDRQALSLVAGVGAAETVLESLDVFADVANAEVSVDGVPHGRAPLSLAVAAGIHHVRVTAAGRLPVEERVDVAPGTPTLFRAELNQLKSGLEAPEAAHGEHAQKSQSPSHAAVELGPCPKGRVGCNDPMAAARTDVMAGNYASAVTRLETLRKTALAPTQLQRALLLEAQAWRLALRPERAVPLLEKVAKGDGPEAEQGQMMLAQALGRDLGDPRRAAVVWAEAQRRFPQGIFREEVAFRLGESLIAAGQPREGVEALERFLSTYPAGAHADDAHLSIAAARRDRLSDCAGAIPHLRAVANGPRGLGNPRAEVALIGAARCLQQIGRTDEARDAYARYLAQLPRGRFADEARSNAAATARRK